MIENGLGQRSEAVSERGDRMSERCIAERSGAIA
jgi:hypothetical protein